MSSVKPMKQRLRESFLRKREAVSHAVQHDASQKMLMHFAAHPLCKHLAKATVVAAYHPTAGELDPLPLLEHLLSHGMVAALPVIVKKESALAFAPWHPEATMQAGKVIAHILEPEHYHEDRCTPSLVMVPLLAVDARGHRLGFGGGYYDRTLTALREQNPALITIGIGYHWQLSKHDLPNEPHDVVLNYFLSEEGITAF